jgi:hypothetical protein
MQNGGPFRSRAGVGFFTKPLNFRVEVHMNTPARVALIVWLFCRSSVHGTIHSSVAVPGEALSIVPFYYVVIWTWTASHLFETLICLRGLV